MVDRQSDRPKHVRRECRCLERRYRKTGAEEDYVVWRKAARAAMREANAARSGYYLRTVVVGTGDSKKLWSAVNKLLHKNKPDVCIGSSVALDRAKVSLFSLLTKLLKLGKKLL